MGIDLEFLKNITGDKTNRNTKWDDDYKLKGQLKNVMTELMGWIERNTSYRKSNIASIVISIYRFIKAEENNKKRFSKDKFKRPKPLNYEYREIIYAELGGFNYGVEASYEHPAVVIHNGYYFLLVIPGSTGRVNKSDYIINVDEKENFEHQTGLQVDQIRVIDKSRVINRTHKKVSPELMKDINRKILEKYLYPVNKEFTRIRKENEVLKAENEKLQLQISKLEKKVD